MALLLKQASANVNPLSMSRNALLTSVRRASPLKSQKPSFVGPVQQDIFQSSSCEDPFAEDAQNDVQLCTAAAAVPASNPLVKNLIRGAALRVASDLAGGTPLENIKCRVTATGNGPFKTTRDLVTGGNGFWNLWSGTPSRTVEGALMGAAFMVASAATKTQVMKFGGSTLTASLASGVIGGIAQAVIMTPSGMIFTSLNVNKGKPGYENDTTISVIKRIVDEKGVKGLFIGGKPMAIRQASNWASRSAFTEICRTNLRLSRFGIAGEIASGAIGGVGSCWNTPIETVRVVMQRDVAQGIPPKTFGQYVTAELEEGGIQNLFRGVTPRAVQAIGQTCFMVVVPTLLGM